MANENQLKYDNYKEQFKRLDKAIKSCFYLEAMFIAYAIMEDRSDSILSYEGNEIHSKSYTSIDRKLKKIKKISEQKNSLPARYFKASLIDDILDWKEKRNHYMHALMKGVLTTEELYDMAAEGRMLARELANKATNYRRAVERKHAKEDQDFVNQYKKGTAREAWVKSIKR